MTSSEGLTRATSSGGLSTFRDAALRAMTSEELEKDNESEASEVLTEVDAKSDSVESIPAPLDAEKEKPSSGQQAHATTRRASLALTGGLAVEVDPVTKRASLSEGVIPNGQGRSSLLNAFVGQGVGVIAGGARASVGVIAGGARASLASLVGFEPGLDEAAKDQETLEKEEIEYNANWDTSKFERDELATMSASLTFKNVTFSIRASDPDAPGQKIEKIILDNAWGHFEPGTLTALMGPSGCGKSTLLDILAQKKTSKYSGEVFMNGMPVDRMYPRITSYVSQQDIIPAHWTVLEAVKFDALLKKPRPKGVSAANFETYVSSVLDDVGLLHVKDTKIGNESVRGISGGQRRRVTLARGIVAYAPLMFCDEPTSGLSATDAELCVKALLGIARRRNVTILVVIHQPRVEVAQLFDNLLLLTSRPGRVVYNGLMKDAPEHWRNVQYPVPEKSMNPLDFLLDTVSPGIEGADPERFVKYDIKHMLPKRIIMVEQALKGGKTAMDMLTEERDTWSQKIGHIPKVSNSIYGTGWGTQFKAVLSRKVKLTFRDPALVAVLFLARIVTGVLYGILMQDKGSAKPVGFAQVPFIFMCLEAVTLQAMLVMPLTFEERSIMKSEVSQALYCNSAYIAATSIVDMLLSFVGTIPQLAILNAMAGMEWSKFPVLLLWCTILGLSMDALVLSMAAACKCMAEAQVAVLPLLTTPIMFGGLLVNRNSSPGFLAWLLDISPVNNAMEQLTYSYYGEGCSDTNMMTSSCEGWKQITYFFGHEKPTATRLLAVFATCFVLFRILHAVALTKLNNIAK